MGSMLLGVIFSAILYGISLLQCLFYFTRYKRDPIYLKVIVTLTLFLDTFHLSLVVHTLSHRNYFATGFVLVLVLATNACGTESVIIAYTVSRPSPNLGLHLSFSGSNSALTITINALSAAADVYITAMMCLMLRQSNPESVEPWALIRLQIAFTINTGL
ncbi:hypothetical protein R3P38DRAFT_3311646 [Favolaschia claudopus]|uniref:Uncharacterized protein n=1 Tax=Favolaschia claudopus TaxID=2862362 RepID=A0AAW0CGG6_9AGAR